MKKRDREIIENKATPGSFAENDIAAEEISAHGCRTGRQPETQ